jgi:hypothetical protein
MIIYSNNLAEKLFGYAISRDFLKYSSPFCDLVDDPDLKLDFDLAILFNKGLNGDQDAVKQFTEDFIVNGPALDVSTINFYASKINLYPAFKGQIQRVEYVLGNYTRIPETGDYNSRFATLLKEAFKDCLNSPCNYFSQNSESVAKLAEQSANMNLATMPSFADLLGEFTTGVGGVGKDIWNKVPTAFTDSFAELAAIGQAAWTECISMFTIKDTDALVKKARSGVSLRGGINAEGYIYTPDFKSYLDHNSAASNILGKTANKMGDCFRQYQQANRYNPYNPDMNYSTSNKPEVADQSNGVVYERDITGPSVNTGGTSNTNKEALGFIPFVNRLITGSNYKEAIYDGDRELYNGEDTIVSNNTGEVYYEFTVMPGDQVSTFGGWYDIGDPDSPSGRTVWGDSFYATSGDLLTIKGIGIYDTNYIYCPSQSGTINNSQIGANDGFVKYINEGYYNNEDYTKLIKKAFNNGVALKNSDLRKYNVNPLNAVVEITYKNKVYKNVVVIDRGGLDFNTRLDVTPWLLYKIGGVRPTGTYAGKAFADGTEITIRNNTSFSNNFVGMKVRVLRKS